MPGGHISAFCDAEIRISMPHSSCRISIPPTPLTESTIKSASLFRTTAPIPGRSATIPVELSLCTATTARYGTAFNRLSTSEGSMAPPHSTSSTSTCAPIAAAIFANRSPNCPFTQTSTRSPGATALIRLASITPVPEQAKNNTGFDVPSSGLMRCSTSAKIARNSGPR